MGLKLWYIDGSPFARILRVTLLELGLEHEAIEIEGFPPKGIAAINPALQVPALADGGRSMFGSDLIRRYLYETCGVDRGDFAGTLVRPGRQWEDLQVLLAIQAMTDAVVVHHYSVWAGVGPVGPNKLGLDPAARNMERAMSLLDWLEGEACEDGFWPGACSAADVALGCAIFWTESRRPIAWRGRPRLERIVARMGERDSFRRTTPRHWSPDPG